MLYRPSSLASKEKCLAKSRNRRNKKGGFNNIGPRKDRDVFTWMNLSKHCSTLPYFCDSSEYACCGKMTLSLSLSVNKSISGELLEMVSYASLLKAETTLWRLKD